MRLICRSSRLTLTGAEILEQPARQGRCVFAFWHSRIFFLAYYYARFIRSPRIATLISLSRDGDYASALVEQLGQDAVRGSSSRGGMKAMRALSARLAEGYNVALTPDGPRGPACRVQDGVVRLAQITGAKVIPVSYDARSKWTLRSWDRFILPKPFSRIHVAVGEPICVPNQASPEELREHCARLEHALTALDRLCADQVAHRAAVRRMIL
ncbi:MAG: lysophospholipid acyltransferase family protein [Phycisphaerae bacterium]|nr:lysophospholipid acyltransferase family protein [Phycisphaerae bacterium]